LRPQLRLCLAAKPALLPRAALHEAEAGQTCAYGAGQAGILKRPGNGHAQPAAAPFPLAGKGAASGCSPHRRALRSRRPAATAARFVGPHGRAL